MIIFMVVGFTRSFALAFLANSVSPIVQEVASARRRKHIKTREEGRLVKDYIYKMPWSKLEEEKERRTKDIPILQAQVALEDVVPYTVYTFCC